MRDRLRRLGLATALLLVALLVLGCSTSGDPTKPSDPGPKPPDPHGGFAVTSSTMCVCPSTDGFEAKITLAWIKAERDADASVQLLLDLTYTLLAEGTCKVSGTPQAPKDGACQVRAKLGKTLPILYEVTLRDMGGLVLSGGQQNGPPPACTTCPLS